MPDISNQQRAKREKNDEFYTHLSDIEKGVSKYKKQFEGKRVFLPCDDVELLPALEGTGTTAFDKSSKFWVFFHKKFADWKLKEIIATHYNEDGSPSYKISYKGGNDADISKYERTELKGNGDFRSEEVQKIYKQADIVCTNPPFSLFREFFDNLIELKKDFLIIGSFMSVTYKDVFEQIKSNTISVSKSTPTSFTKALNGKIVGEKKILISWFTTFNEQTWSKPMLLYKKYKGHENEYPEYDNIKAINVDKVKDIPMDYDGLMGVPITFLNQYNPEQFEIVGNLNGGNPDGTIGGVFHYARIVIKTKPKIYPGWMGKSFMQEQLSKINREKEDK